MSIKKVTQIQLTEDRQFDSRYFSSNPIDVRRGDSVGVVLLVPGAPESESEIRAYLYRHFMLPGIPSGGLWSWLSHLKSRIKARFAFAQVLEEYRAIGGGSTINRFNIEQAADLRRRLKACVVIPEGVKTKTYLASPFGSPSMADAAQKMMNEGITHVVLLSLFPQFALDTTGRALSHWGKTVADYELSKKPTVAIWDFTVKDSFVEAMNERIDQAIQRFPRMVRPEVAILFTANGKTIKPSIDGGDPYCCLVHHTVDRVMGLRPANSSYFLSFVRQTDWKTGIGTSLKSSIESIVAAGHRSVVVVPVDHVSEQFDSAHLLEVDLRKLAETLGITHYHVASGLNCHPLFMEGLADMVIESIVPAKRGTEAVSCMKSCPRAGWKANGSSVSVGHELCSICPFGPAEKEVEDHVERPFRRHVHAIPGQRPAVQKTK